MMIILQQKALFVAHCSTGFIFCVSYVGSLNLTKVFYFKYHIGYMVFTAQTV